ncbi:MAG: hypothetical protein N3C61_00110 [Candidatus Micrarchaeota archaeon]|nr:hypothetical protein [Candidatus Micrarchaeota archaeon]
MIKRTSSKNILYLPAHYDPILKRFQDDNENSTKNLYSLNDILFFVFPQNISPKYYDISVKFLNLLIQKRGVITGDDIGEFVRANGISKATLYSKVLLKLKMFGLVKIERQFVDINKKSRKMKVSLSKTFGNYLNKIADSWLAIVDEVRSQQQ